MGQCYSECFENGVSLTQRRISRHAAAIRSLIHVDWMIGGPETEIDGVGQDGARVPVFRKGNWAV
ncbi:MAG: aminopeptidase [Paracoccaceae bacterium]